MGKETVNDREMDKKRKKSSTNDLPPTKISKEDVYNVIYTIFFKKHNLTFF